VVRNLSLCDRQPSDPGVNVGYPSACTATLSNTWPPAPQLSDRLDESERLPAALDVLRGMPAISRGAEPKPCFISAHVPLPGGASQETAALLRSRVHQPLQVVWRLDRIRRGIPAKWGRFYKNVGQRWTKPALAPKRPWIWRARFDDRHREAVFLETWCPCSATRTSTPRTDENVPPQVTH